jgi:ornithine cyclodeaminase/alanine dehydrogenase-like protein (mu-crystallin family)
MTAKRTGAATAVALKFLTRSRSKIFGEVGQGAQGRSNLEVLHEALKNFEEVLEYNIPRTESESYLHDFKCESALSAQAVESPS